ncbi:MAG: MerR family transcriptional regulator [Bacilli bacterium]|nr:MerR family transcriptional regulator [Bacilli bacterium]
MKIGEFSKMTGVSVKTLRYYDNINLIKPKKINKDNKYREYTEDQIFELNKILTLKNVGLTIKEIKQVLEKKPSNDQLAEMLENKLKEAYLEEVQAHNNVIHLQSSITHLIEKEKVAMKVNLNKMQLSVIDNTTISQTQNEITICSVDDKHCFKTPSLYNLPVDIRVTAKTDSTNLRLYYNKGVVIFNWECNQRELRIHDIITGEQFGFDGIGNIPINEYVNVDWFIDRDKMVIKVNDKIILENNDLPYIKILSNTDVVISSTIGVGSALGSKVTIKDIEVN